MRVLSRTYESHIHAIAACATVVRSCLHNSDIERHLVKYTQILQQQCWRERIFTTAICRLKDTRWQAYLRIFEQLLLETRVGW